MSATNMQVIQHPITPATDLLLKIIGDLNVSPTTEAIGSPKDIKRTARLDTSL